MEFLENVKSVLAKTSQTVAKKSTEVYEASKVKYEILTLKNDIRKLYAEIGKLTYKTIIDGEDYGDDVSMKCDIVKAKLAKIEVLSNEGFSTNVDCPECGRPSGAESDHCESCGADLAVDVDAEVE